MEMSDWQLNEQVLNENDIPNMRGEFKFFSFKSRDHAK